MLNFVLVFLLLISTASQAGSPTRAKDGIISDASISIGDSSAANSKSVLDVKSTAKGALLPRMTTTQRDAISSPPTGLIVYNTTTTKLNQYNGVAWVEVGGGAGGIFSGGQNLLVYNSWETDTSGWTASGGTYTRVTAAGNIVPPGVGAGSWDPSAGSQTLTSDNVTVTSNDGLSGRNGVLSCAIKTAATDLKMQVYDGTNVLTANSATNLVPSSSAGFVRYTLNFAFPASGTIKARFLSASNSVVAYIDDCYLGLAEGFNISNVSQASFYGSAKWATATSCVWDITQTTFASDYAAVSACNNPSVTGSVSAAATKVPQIVLNSPGPATYMVFVTFSGYQAVSSLMSFRLVDDLGTELAYNSLSSSTAEVPGRVLIGSISYTSGQSNRTIKIQGRGGSGATQIYADNTSGGPLEFQVIKLPLSTDTILNAATMAKSWSGNHAQNCAFSRTSTSYGDPGGDSTCTFSERANVNFGTVTSYQSGGNNGSGIVFTESTPSRYFVCATTSIDTSTTNVANIELVDGNNVRISESEMYSGTSGQVIPMTLCGQYGSSSGAQTLKLRTKADGGTITLLANYSSSIEWTVFKINENMPAPLLVNTVVSPSAGVEKFVRATMLNGRTSSCTVQTQSGSWISSGSRSSTGICVWTLNAGTFSASPTCICSSNGNGGNMCYVSVSSSTSLTLVSLANGGAADDDASLICMGPP